MDLLGVNTQSKGRNWERSIVAGWRGMVVAGRRGMDSVHPGSAPVSTAECPVLTLFNRCRGSHPQPPSLGSTEDLTTVTVFLRPTLGPTARQEGYKLPGHKNLEDKEGPQSCPRESHLWTYAPDYKLVQTTVPHTGR